MYCNRTKKQLVLCIRQQNRILIPVWARLVMAQRQNDLPASCLASTLFYLSKMSTNEQQEQAYVVILTHVDPVTLLAVIKTGPRSEIFDKRIATNNCEHWTQVDEPCPATFCNAIVDR